MGQMNASPTISVVMSVYNDAEHVGSAIDSIRNQTFEDWELIAVNDGSTDQSLGILTNSAKHDSRIRVLDQSNTGLTLALIRGCAEARGAYIARQDSDDWALPDRFSKQLKLLRNDSMVGFASCWAQYIGPFDEPLELVERHGDPHQATEQLLNHRVGPPGHGTVMFRRALYEAIGGYRREFYFGQDSDLWLRMAEQSSIGYVPETLYHARRELQSTSGSLRSVQKRFGELGQLCRHARAKGQSEDSYLIQAAELTQRVRAGAFSGATARDGVLAAAYAIGSQLTTQRDGRAARYLWQVIRKQPWHWRAWVRLLQLRSRRQHE